MSEKKDYPPKNIPSVQVKYPAFASDLLTHDFIDEVVRVYNRMLDRLYYGAHKRRGWATSEPWKELTEHECRTCIRDSLAKGNLIDAMNYLMFAHLNGHKLLSLRNPSIDEPVSIDSQMRDQLANAMGVTGRSWDEMLAMVGEVNAQAFEHQTTLETIAATLKLDFEASDESILSAINTLITPRKVEPEARQYAVTGINIPGGTDPETLENIAKVIKANRQMAAFEGYGRKASLSPAMAAPYGVKADKKQQQYELTMEADDSGIPSPLFIFRSKKDRDDYLPLLRTLLGALEQAAYGKGRERHANDLPFIEQPILTMAHMLDSDAGLAQQVIKKTVEARSLPTKQARINELRGTLVYAAAMILFEEMYGRADDPDELDGDF